MNSFDVLTIVAHPDDESFLFAGVTLVLREQGKSIGVVCATRGEKGADRLNRELTEQQMAKIRTQELYSACDILHCRCEKFLEYHDGQLDRVDFDRLVANIKNVIEACKPEMVLTFGDEGISGHKDHIVIGQAVLQACGESEHKPSEIWRASIPRSLVDSFHEHMEKRKIHHMHFIKKRLKGAPDEKLTRIDVSKYKDTKIKALEAHQSQYLPHLTWPNSLESEWFEIIKQPKPAGRRVD